MSAAIIPGPNSSRGAGVVREIRVVKPDDQCILPDRKASLMKRISDMETELGRMMKLLNEMRADALHLTVE